MPQLDHFPSIIENPKSEWEEMMTEARVALAITTPLLSFMMFRCKFVWTDDVDIPRAGAMPYNGINYLLFNPAFLCDELPNTKQRAFIVLHELLHIFLEHIGRQLDCGYDTDLWNTATDYLINLIASGAYLGTCGIAYTSTYKNYFECPPCGLFKERFIGMSADEIYHLLIEEHDGDARAAVAAHGGVVGDEMGEGQRPLDRVSELPMSNEQEMQNRQTIAGAVANAKQSDSIGVNEGSLIHSLTELSKPIISWTEELDTTIAGSSFERSTYNRLSHLEGEGGVVFPRMTGDRINAVLGFDSSGSMQQGDYCDVLGEFSGILEQYDSWLIRLVSCDMRTHLLGEYDSEDGVAFEDMNITAHGLGGTDMTPIVSYTEDMEQGGEEINACIIITDGKIPEELFDRKCEEVEFSVIVVVTRNGNQALALNNAKVIHLPKEH